MHTTDYDSHPEQTERCDANSNNMQKHRALWREIQNINSISQQLAELIERVTGPIPKNETGGDKAVLKAHEPSLAKVLNEGASEINQIVGHIQKQIAELENILF